MDVWATTKHAKGTGSGSRDRAVASLCFPFASRYYFQKPQTAAGPVHQLGLSAQKGARYPTMRSTAKTLRKHCSLLLPRSLPHSPRPSFISRKEEALTGRHLIFRRRPERGLRSENNKAAAARPGRLGNAGWMNPDQTQGPPFPPPPPPPARIKTRDVCGPQLHWPRGLHKQS